MKAFIRDHLHDFLIAKVALSQGLGIPWEEEPEDWEDRYWEYIPTFEGIILLSQGRIVPASMMVDWDHGMWDR